MRKEFELPRQGEVWAGWVPEMDNVRRLEIIQVHGSDLYQVGYSKRGEGLLETAVSSVYLIQPWDSYKQEQQARRNKQSQARELEKALRLAITDSKMSCSAPWVYSGGACTLKLNQQSAQVLLHGLARMADGNSSNSSLTRIFG